MCHLCKEEYKIGNVYNDGSYLLNSNVMGTLEFIHIYRRGRYGEMKG